MLLLRYWLHYIDEAVCHYFTVLAEGDTPESWGECPIVIADEFAQKNK